MPQHQSTYKYTVAIIVTSVVGGVLTIAMAVAIAILVRRNRRHRYRLIPMLGDDEIRFIDNITLVQKIGSGQFGDVYTAWMDVRLFSLSLCNF